MPQRPELVSVDLPRTLWEQLRKIARANERSAQAELRVAVTAYVRQQESQ